jgi:hypothetical protein
VVAAPISKAVAAVIGMAKAHTAPSVCAAETAVAVAVFSAVVVVASVVSAVSVSAAKLVATRVEVKTNAPKAIVAINFFIYHLFCS